MVLTQDMGPMMEALFIAAFSQLMDTNSTNWEAEAGRLSSQEGELYFSLSILLEPWS